jgi:catechol 2,3-dioxygenase-like lactoylglutathione lyase family enzyme
MEHLVAKLIQDFESGKMSRRQLIQSLALTATATSVASSATASDTNVVRATYINHISYRVADYAKTRDFYSGLFGMKVSEDDGKKCRLSIGQSIIVARSYASETPRVDHISLSIANWDSDMSVKDRVAAELKRRGLDVQTNKNGYDFKDPDGFQVQIGGHKQ